MDVDSLERQQKGHMSSLRLFHSVCCCFCCCCCYFIVIFFILFAIGISMAKKKLLARLVWERKVVLELDTVPNSMMKFIILMWFDVGSFFLDFIFVSCNKHMFHRVAPAILIELLIQRKIYSNKLIHDFAWNLPKCTEDAYWISSPESFNVHSSSGSKP